VIVLNVRQNGLEIMFVMVIHQGDGSGDLRAAELLPMLNQSVANHIRDRQRAVVIAPFAGHLVQLIQQRTRQRNTETGDRFNFHAVDNAAKEPAGKADFGDSEAAVFERKSVFVNGSPSS
jgi:hypothetical protein